jgi:hypothetical protein
MSLLVVAALIQAAQPAPAATPVPPVERLCLLAGPSQSLVAVRVVPDGESYAVRRVDGQPWPFSVDALQLRAVPERREFAARDEAANLHAAYQLFMADGGGTNLWIARGAGRFEGLPLLGGSCAEAGSAAAAQYLRQARDPAFAPQRAAADFRTKPLAASAHCQVVSAAGWVSRFSFEFAANSDDVTIRAADRHLWRSPSVASSRRGLPAPSNPQWIRFAFHLPSSAEIPRSINSFWVHAAPDGSQSSMRASFFGYDPDGPVSGEDLTGVCAAFAGEERTAR